MQRNKSTISRYINGVPENGELIADSVVAFFLQQLSTVVKIGKKIFSKNTFCHKVSKWIIYFWGMNSGGEYCNDRCRRIAAVEN